jgi:serine/threonine-protein kinase
MKRFLKRTIVILVLAVLVFFLGYMLVDRVVMPRIVGVGKEVDVPDVSGKSLGDAKDILDSLGLRYAVQEQRYDAVVPRGYVISQQPLPNRKIKKDGVMSLVTSLGQEKVSVPDLVDMSVMQARSLIDRLGLRLGRIDTVYSDSIKGGRITSTVPPADTLVYKGTYVNITVSRTAEATFAMPDLMGMKIEAAQDSLKRLGLQVSDLRVVESPDSPKGTVLLQSPQAGMIVKRGDKVVLAVTSGRQ